ncbi:MAG TPA: STAS domain-containing protein [Acidimicrobiales bacterium]|nr:STAS domain-containing protein [Acidimicrobiales bacterium]
MTVVEKFSVRYADDGTTYTLSCHGPIDASATEAMRAATLHALSSRCEVIVVDLSGVTLVDSAGVTSMLLAHKAAEIAGVELRFVGARKPVVRVLRLAGGEQLVGSA